MNAILSEILETNQVADENGLRQPLHSAIDAAEITFITKLIKDYKCVATIEVGCAMGISSLAICEAVKNNDPQKGKHLIIDPFQKTEWGSIGINNLKKAGLANFTLLEEKSEFILPQLNREGYMFDFAFIDGWHTFDHTLIDFFYLNRMLKVGGIMVIDDVGMPAINKVARYIHNYPAYHFVGSTGGQATKARRALERIKSAVGVVSKFSGKKVSTELFSSDVLRSNTSLGLNASMIAFKKIAEDERPWNWHEPF